MKGLRVGGLPLPRSKHRRSAGIRRPWLSNDASEGPEDVVWGTRLAQGRQPDQGYACESMVSPAADVARSCTEEPAGACTVAPHEPHHWRARGVHGPPLTDALTSTSGALAETSAWTHQPLPLTLATPALNPDHTRKSVMVAAPPPPAWSSTREPAGACAESPHVPHEVGCMAIQGPPSTRALTHEGPPVTVASIHHSLPWTLAKDSPREGGGAPALWDCAECGRHEVLV